MNENKSTIDQLKEIIKKMEGGKYKGPVLLFTEEDRVYDSGINVLPRKLRGVFDLLEHVTADEMEFIFEDMAEILEFEGCGNPNCEDDLGACFLRHVGKQVQIIVEKMFNLTMGKTIGEMIGADDETLKEFDDSVYEIIANEDGKPIEEIFAPMIKRFTGSYEKPSSGNPVPDAFMFFDPFGSDKEDDEPQD